MIMRFLFVLLYDNAFPIRSSIALHKLSFNIQCICGEFTRIWTPKTNQLPMATMWKLKALRIFFSGIASTIFRQVSLFRHVCFISCNIFFFIEIYSSFFCCCFFRGGGVAIEIQMIFYPTASAHL